MAGVATTTRAAGPAVHEPADVAEERLFEPHGATLEDSIIAVWDDLVAGRDAECPVCGGSMSMIECSGCGSELS